MSDTLHEIDANIKHRLEHNMNTYKFTAMTSTGKEISGRVSAKSESDASSQVKQLGHFPTSIKLVDQKSTPTNEPDKYNKEDSGKANLPMFIAGLVLGIIIGYAVSLIPSVFK